MREQVIARHLGSGATKPATIDYETSTMVDEQGNNLNFLFWTYEEKSKLDVSPGFRIAFWVIFIGICFGASLIFSGATK